MPTRLLLLAAAGLAVAALSGCDASSGPTASADKDTRQVTVVGAGEVQGTPDTLTINASMEFIAPDATGAMNQTSDRQQAVIDALVGAGVDRKDISTSQASLQPQFAGGDSTAIIGYRASNSIDVKIRKLDTAVAGTGADRQHRRRCHPHQLGELHDRGRLTAGEGRPRASVQRREGPRRAVRAAVRARSRQGHLDHGIGRCDTTHARCPTRGAPRWRPCQWSPASRRSVSR